MNRYLKIGLGAFAGIVILSAIGGAGEDATPAPTQTQTEVPMGDHLDDGGLLGVETTTTTERLSSCDTVREALLTGSPSEVVVAMRALQADRSESQEARERAAEYLRRVSEYGSGHELVGSMGQLVANGCELY